MTDTQIIELANMFLMISIPVLTLVAIAVVKAGK